MEKEIANYHQYLKRRYPESSTSKHYVSDLGIFRQFVGARPLREISLHTIDAFIEQQTHQKLKPKTINRRLAAISGFADGLVDGGGLPTR
jgi:site-specific recombinase XerD